MLLPCRYEDIGQLCWGYWLSWHRSCQWCGAEPEHAQQCQLDMPTLPLITPCTVATDARHPASPMQTDSCENMDEGLAMLGMLRQLNPTLNLALLSICVLVFVVVIVKAAAALVVVVLQLQPELVSQGVAAPRSAKELLLVPGVCVSRLVALHPKTRTLSHPAVPALRELC